MVTVFFGSVCVVFSSENAKIMFHIYTDAILLNALQI